MTRKFFDLETACLQRLSPEQKLRTLDAIRRSARLATELGDRIRRRADEAAPRAESKPSVDGRA